MEQNCPENLLQCRAEQVLIYPKNPPVKTPEAVEYPCKPLSPSLPIYLSNLPSIHSISFSLDRCITTVLYVLPRARPPESGPPRCCNPKSTKTEIVSPFCGKIVSPKVSFFFLSSGRIDFLEDVPFLRSHVDRKGRKRKLSPRNENARL